MDRRRKNIRTRTFGGCVTCRSRHVKCDEIRPSCRTCHQSGLFCEGYQTTLVFDSEGHGGARGIRYRRPLLTEAEAKHMSDFLRCTIPPELALHHLIQLDDECENASKSSRVCASRGPFGVFRVNTHTPDVNSVQTQQESPELRGMLCDDDELQIDDQIFQSSHLDDLLFSSISFPWPVVQEGQPPDSPFQRPRLLENLSDRVREVTHVDPLAEIEWISPASSSPSPPTQTNESTFETRPTVYAPPFLDSLLSTSLNVPSDTLFLLQRFKDFVLPLMTLQSHSKTPWHTLFVPFVKRTLAGLTLGETMDTASLTGFYGTLAISALSLAGCASSQFWLDRAANFTQFAQDRARTLLMTVYQEKKIAKYKDVLMALLVMARMSITAGSRDQADGYLLEAEKLIRLKGLQPNKSRKRRVLHHCYAFERFLHESLFVSGCDLVHRERVRRSVASSGKIVFGQDSGRFKTPDLSNIDTQETMVKSQDEGENDLHLERVGIWPASLYDEIFGIPEHWVLLFSLTIRLGYERDDVDQVSTTNPLSLHEYLKRARSIETRINKFRRVFSNGPLPTLDSEPNRLVHALYHGLTIYFYRRVYNLDSELVQPFVTHIRDCLSGDNIMAAATRCSYPVTWMAFVAACEAQDSHSRRVFADWFTKSARDTGLSCFTGTLRTIQQVWKPSEVIETASRSWVDVVKEGPLVYQYC
ncbi:hypothetical protein K461DRAFT_256994 [Myriangium duriaei CBS 260.36]|uniref:Zn(2)-C6 fungal-type domain-containing protein n=1 Tax=Myriangium duriaei CBS 260.36 TaxID=1168546 RepID=A0A9P4IZK0_9PEZI|nr:hypothetical protein K461DRAFT_256994 [Myriangium duriaei CBS 260.36]